MTLSTPLFDSVASDSCSTDACDLDDWIPGDDDVASQCEDADVPPSVSRRLTRARALMVRADAASGKRQLRLGRKAARLVRSAIKRADRTLPERCRETLKAMLDGAVACCECRPADGQDGDRPGRD